MTCQRIQDEMNSVPNGFRSHQTSWLRGPGISDTDLGRMALRKCKTIGICPEVKRFTKKKE